MTFEAVLASLHLLAILTLMVFVTSQAALCRSEWMNAAVVQRLARLDVIYGIVAVVLLLTGLARLFWGVKGIAGYTGSPLFHLKMTLFVIGALLSIKPSIAFRRWKRALDASGQLPSAAEIVETRRWVMRQAHVIPLIAVVAIFWARGM
ncbi:membrane protein [Comamonas phosphati]|nr:membrane protein [Comamonas phosphati]